jgi:transaldolase
VTSNPTIFQKAISQGNAYDAQMKELLEDEQDAKEIFLHLAVSDVESALDLLEPVHERNAQDGYVSIEVDPNLAYDTQATYDEAIRLHEWIDRPNLYVKIPGTSRASRRSKTASPPAAASTDAPVLAADAQQVDGGLHPRARALRRGRRRPGKGALGGELLRLARRHRGRQAAREIGGHDELKGKLASRTRSSPTSDYKESSRARAGTPRRRRARPPQRCLWASTSTKNPDYRDVLYVEELIGPDTVNTMPEETIEAFQDHGEVALTLEQGIDEAKRLSTSSPRSGSTTTT